jgi:Rad3-related DNA helicase
VVKFKRDDGTGRPPRGLQSKATDWLEANWEGPEVLALQLPTGVGKSWLARMLQQNTKGQIVVPSNILMDDTYTKVYPTVNFLKGKAQYQCKEHTGFNCQEVVSGLKKKQCPDCPYSASKQSALIGAPTFFNPMSLFYLQKDKRYRKPDVIIVDEAHQLRDMLLLISGKQFRKGKYNFPDTTSELEIIEWMQAQFTKLCKLYSALLDAEERDDEMIAEVAREVETIDCTLRGIKEAPQNYCIYMSEGQHRKQPEKYLNVIPLEPPRYLVNQLLDCKKLILLSATLPRTRVETLLQGKPYKYLDMPSPIDKKRRTVYYKPTPFPMNYKTDPAAIAKHVEAIVKEHPGQNVMIHASYGLAAKMAPFFTIPILTHTAETKTQALDLFKERGGVLLASGMAEGIDLRGDLCRLNIIPMLQRLNVYDPGVKKRMAWKDGRLWYDMETLSTVMQQAGRSTRGEDDWSRIIVCDPAFPKLLSERSKELPISFVESISWTGRYKDAQ